MTRDPKPAGKPEAYHREQTWVFRIHEKVNGVTQEGYKQHTKVKAKTLESALKQVHNRFPEDKYEAKYVKTEPVVSEEKKHAAQVISDARRARADYLRGREEARKERAKKAREQRGEV